MFCGCPKLHIAFPHRIARCVILISDMSMYIILFILENLLELVLNKWTLERAFLPNKHCGPLGQRRRLNKSHKGGKTVGQTSSNMRVLVRVRPKNAKEMGNNSRYDCCHISDLLRSCFPRPITGWWSRSRKEFWWSQSQ
jgi:hypothetical protein